MKDPVDIKTKAAQAKQFGSLIGLILVLLIGAGLVLYLTQYPSGTKNEAAGGGQKKGKKDKNKDGDKNGKDAAALPGAAFVGGTFEASGVAHLPGTNGVLVVDDSRQDEVLWVELDQAGKQVGQAKPISLGVEIDDPEAITTDGTYFYITGSQGDPKSGQQNALARFRFDPGSRSVSNAEVISDVRTALLASVAELRGDGEKEGKDGGLAIEGIAWDDAGKRLLLGLRSPLRDRRALVVALTPRQPDGAFTAENLMMTAVQVIQLPLENDGIRDIQYDSRMKSFLILSGAPEDQKRRDFILWAWDGNSPQRAPRKLQVLDSDVRPEGITRVAVGGSEYIFIVCDASRYLTLEYPSGSN